MTTFDDELSEFAREFLDSDVLGYVIGAHTSGDIPGIYTRRYVESEQIAGIRPIFSITDADADSLTIDSPITINDVPYLIREKQSDGAGLTTLILEG